MNSKRTWLVRVWMLVALGVALLASARGVAADHLPASIERASEEMPAGTLSDSRLRFEQYLFGSGVTQTRPKETHAEMLGDSLVRWEQYLFGSGVIQPRPEAVSSGMSDDSRTRWEQYLFGSGLTQ